MHSVWIGKTLSLLLYVLMNVAQVSFISGITRLLWKHVYPEMFTVMATCDSKGSLVPRSKISGASHEGLIHAIQTRSIPDGSADDGELSKELHAKLRRCLRNFSVTGITLLMVSLCANGLWIYALTVTSQTLTPQYLLQQQ